MANRYLVATGNWNSTSVWSATSGGAPGASVPTVGDSVSINANYTVTLTADAECASLEHTNGGLNLQSYRLDVTDPAGIGFSSHGSTARSINLGSGTLSVFTYLYFTGSNLTFTAGTSLIRLNYNGDYNNGDFDIGSHTFNDVIITLGLGGVNGDSMNLIGSPTFRLLDIRSANSAAHTVNFDSGAIITTEHFKAFGSSSANKLALVGGDTNSKIRVNAGGSSEGQYVSAQIKADTSTGVQYYIGSSSIQTTGYGWLLQDPPPPMVVPSGNFFPFFL